MIGRRSPASSSFVLTRALPGAMGCGRSSWTPPTRRHGTGSYEEKPQEQSHIQPDDTKSPGQANTPS
jgi:hypothetical protein